MENISSSNSINEVLIVEDNFHVATVMKQIIIDSGSVNNAYIVRDGEDAINYLFANGIYEYRANKPLPGLILLDIHLPRVDGFQVLRTVKESDKTRNIPVVVITVLDRSSTLQKCMELGAEYYIVKPLDVDKLKNIIREIGNIYLKS